MTPEFRPVEKGVVIKEVINPKPISKFPDDSKRDLHLRYTVSQMMREGYDEMELVDSHTVIKYELVPEEGFDNLYDAYVDWWNKIEKLKSYWNCIVPEAPFWKSQLFYPINPIEEKENTMQFTISKNQIKRQINALEDLRQDQIKEIQKDLETKLERLEKGETIGAVVIGIRNLSEISEQLEYLYSLELADSISCTESEKAQIFKTFEIAKAIEPTE